MTNKQHNFIEEYLMCYNATQAAINAGYSKKTAYSQGSALLKKPEIQEEIQVRQKEIMNKMDITKEGILKELSLLKSISLAKGNLRYAMESLKEMSKICGIYEADKIDITSKGNEIPVINYIVPKEEKKDGN